MRRRGGRRRRRKHEELRRKGRKQGGGCVSHHAQPPASDPNPYLRSATPVERGCHPGHITIYFLLYPFPNCSTPAVVPASVTFSSSFGLCWFLSLPIARTSFDSTPPLAAASSRFVTRAIATVPSRRGGSIHAQPRSLAFRPLSFLSVAGD